MNHIQEPLLNPSQNWPCLPMKAPKVQMPW